MVRQGADEVPAVGKDSNGKLLLADRVDLHVEMLLQITTDYPGLPDVRTLTASDIRFFYNGLRQSLKKHTQPR